MSKKITVYTTTQCAFCLMVKKYLDSKQTEYTVVNLDEAPDQIPVVEELSGGRAVPVTVIEDGDQKDVIRGWNPGQFNAALGVTA